MEPVQNLYRAWNIHQIDRTENPDENSPQSEELRLIRYWDVVIKDIRHCLSLLLLLLSKFLLWWTKFCHCLVFTYQIYIHYHGFNCPDICQGWRCHWGQEDLGGGVASWFDNGSNSGSEGGKSVPGSE